MEEINGIGAAIKVLGEKIAELESDLKYERLCRENAETRAAMLAEENTALARMLEDERNNRMEGR